MTDHAHDHDAWTHGHVYLGHGHGHAESRTRIATLVTAAFMVVEIAAGLVTGSMALLADGIHMATHVGALGLAAAAYFLARRHAQNTRFTFGSGKFGDLAAFASAIVLGLLGLGVAAESAHRLFVSSSVEYAEALPIAALGLLVNIVSAVILQTPHAHAHHHDHNLRAAYLHVLADAATSVLAIAALAAGWLWNAAILDPLAGIAGAAMIGAWSYSLIRDSALVLLDAEDDPKLAREIRAMIEGELGARVADLHLWRLGPGHRELIVSLVSPDEITAERVRAELRARHASLSHVTVEIAVCADCAS